MHEGLLVENRERFYIELPDVVIRVEGWADVPRIGISEAATPEQAVSQYVFRHAKRNGKLIVHNLKQNCGVEGLGRYAFGVPLSHEYENGSPVSARDQELVEPYELAQAIARKEGVESNDLHLRKADFLIQRANGR